MTLASSSACCSRLAALAAVPAQAALHVFACEPEWASLAQGARRRPGRRLVDDDRAAGPAPDRGPAEPDRAHAQRRPAGLHRRRARGRLAAAAAAAVGQSARAAGAAGPLRGRPTSCASSRCRRSVDRAQGDVHAAGNPHIQTDPRNIAARRDGARARGCSSSMPPTRRPTQQRLADFTPRWQRGHARAGTQQAAPLRGMPVVAQHKDFAYLYELARPARGRRCSSPSPASSRAAAHLQRRCRRSSQAAAGAGWCVHAAYQDPRAVGVAVASTPACRRSKLPFTVGGNDKAKDLFGLFDDTHRAAARRRSGEVNWPALDVGDPRLPAFLAGLLVLATHVPLGMQVLEPRHRLHRPGDRADRRPRRHRRRA